MGTGRLVRTERRVPEESTRIIHTVYEPGSFTPLLRLQKTVTGEDKEPGAVEEIVQAFGHPLMQERMRAYLQDPGAIAALIENNALLQEKLGAQASGFIKAQLQELKRLKQEQDDRDAQGVELSFYLCDHLGTPNALVDQSDNVIWAATLDAWGNIHEEHNSDHLQQSIHLPGQHHDRETNLYYNRHRYYDPAIGAYIKQDPIGLAGGAQKYRYSLQSLRSIDPLGLDTYIANRDLQTFGNSVRSRWNPITHTFSVTTNSDGSIARTYSWGNEFSLKG